MKAVAAVLTVIFLSAGTAMAYEEPDYNVIEQYSDFELRQYAPYIVAETVVTGEFGSVGNKAFRILVDYISGNNQKKVEIPMTAPVNQKPDVANGQKIAMTAPVVQSPDSGRVNTYIFSFIMPSAYTLETLPDPLDPRIRLRQVEGKRMAALQYSGTWSENRYTKKEAILLRAIGNQGLTRTGEPVFARYNSPFTPWFLRRNEVLVEVE